jgi:hypothetical protein
LKVKARRWQRQGHHEGNGRSMAKALRWQRQGHFEATGLSMTKSHRWQRLFDGNALRWQSHGHIEGKALRWRRPFDGKCPSMANALRWQMSFDGNGLSTAMTLRWQQLDFRRRQMPSDGSKCPWKAKVLRWQSQGHFEGKSNSKEKDVQRQTVNCTTITSKHPLTHKHSSLGTARSEDVALPESVGRGMLQRLKRWSR